MKKAIVLVALMLALGVYLAHRQRYKPTQVAAGNVAATHPFAPDFSLTDLAGRNLELSSYRGRVVLLDFWATWCVPCRAEIPRLVQLQAKYRTQGLAVIGISLDDDPKPVEAFRKELHINYPVALGDAKLADRYGGVLGLPVKFLIGRDGRIYDKQLGDADIATIEQHIKSLLSAVPLEGMTGLVGVLALYKSERDAFTKDHLRLLLAISSKVGLCVENARKSQQVEDSATTDYLTDLPNSRTLILHLHRELGRSKRTHAPLAVMVCDLDAFKLVNDRFGHLEGNKVLRTFAQSIKGICREYDFVARMAGDEFVIIVLGLTIEAAPTKAKRLKLLASRAGSQLCREDREHMTGSSGRCWRPQATCRRST